VSYNPYYKEASSSCPADCPGRRSPWRAAGGFSGGGTDDFSCPLGVPFCGAWNAEEIFFKSEKAGNNKTLKKISDDEAAA